MPIKTNKSSLTELHYQCVMNILNRHKDIVEYQVSI